MYLSQSINYSQRVKALVFDAGIKGSNPFSLAEHIHYIIYSNLFNNFKNLGI